MFEIRRLPVPKYASRGSGRPRKYPFDDLAKGMSFLIPTDEQNPHTYTNVVHYCRREGKLLGRLFRAYKTDDGTIQVTRHN